MLILNGKEVAQKLLDDLKIEIDDWVKKGLKKPHLSVVLVGDNSASASYVKNKVRSCAKVGINSSVINLPASISQDELFSAIDELNNNHDVDGYIVQLPLPKHLDENDIVMRIAPKKDVDGFHPINLGRMMLGLPAYLPATPFGILSLLKFYNIDTSGKHCVVVGRSNIVGTPLSVLLSRNNYPGNCTVTLTHSRTVDLMKLTRKADILVAALGQPKFITKDMVKKDAIIIDVGINRVEDENTKRGYRLVGDVDYDELVDHASAMTPVPGGVGPMTVVSLIMNTFTSVKKEIYS